MSRKYFGTDGIRGLVGEKPMTVDFAMKLASAAARVLLPDGGKVVIGKDTRVSGYMFESALEAGFVASGADVYLLGPIPTPGIAYFCQEIGADIGVVISASHNPYYDNGIKFFDGAGGKLSDETEQQIEELLDETIVTRDSEHLGHAKRVSQAVERYKDFCITSVPKGIDLNGLKVVIDCAHGAGYKAAPRVLAELGADLIPIGCSPNGRNINSFAGSTHPELLQLTVKGVGAELGIALDGDGDRCLMVDHNGDLLDGDELLFIIASQRLKNNELKGPVVGTVMSNLGLEHALRAKQVEFMRAKVGDRHVLALLREHGGILGGETSGHILCLDRTTTGDGIISALQVLAAMRDFDQSLAELKKGMTKYPQKLINVRTKKAVDLDATPAITAAVTSSEKELADRGRVVLRASGTEPVIRVMVEGEDESLVYRSAQRIADAVEASAY